MSKEQLQSNIKSSIAGIDGIPQGADDVISNLFTINNELGLLDANLAKVKNLTDHMCKTLIASLKQKVLN